MSRQAFQLSGVPGVLRGSDGDELSRQVVRSFGQVVRSSGRLSRWVPGGCYRFRRHSLLLADMSAHKCFFSNRKKVNAPSASPGCLFAAGLSDTAIAMASNGHNHSHCYSHSHSHSYV